MTEKYQTLADYAIGSRMNKPGTKTGRYEQLYEQLKDEPHQYLLVIGSDGCDAELEVAPRFFLRTYKQPNWFHRLMQRLCFGFIWSGGGCSPGLFCFCLQPIASCLSFK